MKINSFNLNLLFVLVMIIMTGCEPGNFCGGGKIYDCQGNCIDAVEVYDKIDDGECDINLKCREFDFDGGDCDATTTTTPEPDSTTTTTTSNTIPSSLDTWSGICVLHNEDGTIRDIIGSSNDGVMDYSQSEFMCTKEWLDELVKKIKDNQQWYMVEWGEDYEAGMIEVRRVRCEGTIDQTPWAEWPEGFCNYCYTIENESVCTYSADNLNELYSTPFKFCKSALYDINYDDIHTTLEQECADHIDRYELE